MAYAIAPVDNIDDNGNEDLKLETRNSAKTLMEEKLVEIIIEKHLEHVSNNEPCVLTSFDTMDHKRKEIKNATL